MKDYLKVIGVIMGFMAGIWGALALAIAGVTWCGAHLSAGQFVLMMMFVSSFLVAHLVYSLIKAP